jgi:protein translocase SEC61 complex gamma subunit
MDEQNKVEGQAKPKKPGMFSKLSDTLKQYRRVLSVAHKPDKSEMVSSMKITGTGIALLGAIGFIIFLAYFIVTQFGVQA